MLKNSKLLVEMINVGIKRQNKWLVKDISLEVNRGEILTLIGPNGSGKTTTIKLLSGILKPDEGTINSQKDIKLSYVPQNMNVDWTIPINVEYFMRLIALLTCPPKIKENTYFLKKLSFFLIKDLEE